MLVAQLPHRYTASDRIQNVPVEWSRALITSGADNPLKLLQKIGFSQTILQSIDQTDGLRIELGKGDIVHLRPSGNAPELRCYAESTSEEMAMLLVSKVIESLKRLLA